LIRANTDAAYTRELMKKEFPEPRRYASCSNWTDEMLMRVAAGMECGICRDRGLRRRAEGEIRRCCSGWLAFIGQRPLFDGHDRRAV